MTAGKGKIVLMGSGELTSTMVEVHKHLLTGLSEHPKAAFLDTPAGFQPNVDHISSNAVAYFKNRVERDISVVSFKSSTRIQPLEAEKAFHSLRSADYVLIGPGSPTYAVRHLQTSPIPDILIRRIEDGGCLVAASAAALTVGRFTLPVYEIYKVGSDLHWADGLDLLAHFGFNLVVVPHWNNAEGGTHDTRFCFMGEPRFKALQDLLPEDVTIFGLDEHTACIIDLAGRTASIRGIGSITLRHGGRELVFKKGAEFSLDVLSGDLQQSLQLREDKASEAFTVKEDKTKSDFWETIHAIRAEFQTGLEENDAGRATNALLELDSTIMKGQADLEGEESLLQAREVLRDLLVVLGSRLDQAPGSEVDCMRPLIDACLALRANFRGQKQWNAADAVRDMLIGAGVAVEDTPDGTRWYLSGQKHQ